MPDQASSSADVQDVRLQIPELAGRARIRRWVLLALFLGLVGGGLAYYLRPRDPAEMFRTFAVERRDLVQLVEAAGRVDARTRVDVPAPLEGKLVAIQAVEGQLVPAGALLAELDARATALAVRGAQASSAAAAGRASQARAQLAEAQRSLERAQTLFERDLASREDVANAQFELTRARAALEAATGEQRVAGESLASAELEKNLARIVAPAAGVVLRAPERVGAAVTPEAGPLFVIGDPLTTVRIDASVSETDVAMVKRGATAEVEVSAVPGKKFTGRVERVGIDANRVDGAVLYPVVLFVDNPNGELLPGMTARVRMEVSRAQGALSVHEAALRFTPDGADPAPARTRVWKRVAPDRLEPVTVRPLLSDGVYTQVEPIQGRLSEGMPLAVGLLHPEQSGGPRVTLGK